MVCFGVDIGGTAVKVGLFNEEGKLLNKWDFPTKRTEDGKDVLREVAKFVTDKMEENGISLEEVIGVGVGIPGPVKADGEVLELPNLGLGNFNIEEELGALIGVKVKAGNDANVAALGEQWQGSGKGYKDLVMVTLGTGVGGGIILNGTMLAGSNGAAGEIGHIKIQVGEEATCGCGKKGCLEQYASATGIVRMTLKKLAESKAPSSLRTIVNMNAKLVFDHAKAGDQMAMEIVNQACEYLGVALSSIAQVIDPQVFVIGGGVSKAGNILTEKVKEYYNQNVMNSLKNKEFRLAELGNDAGIYGSARLVLV